jgi:large subunit ribosomal protein L15
MKLHDLRPADGSRTERIRVGRGIAAGKGKTAGRGTKGQKARAGGSIPPWFEGGQTPLHMRIPKLRGFRNRFKTEYEVVNVGDIARVVESGRLSPAEPSGKRAAGPITVNQDLLRDAGLIRTLAKPMKVLGDGELSVALFVVADAFTATARQKIEAAGGSVNVLETPGRKTAALGANADAGSTAAQAREADTATEVRTPGPARPGRSTAGARGASAGARGASAAAVDPTAEETEPGAPEGSSEASAVEQPAAEAASVESEAVDARAEETEPAEDDGAAAVETDTGDSAAPDEA